jgi:hypothetical protein
MNRWFRVCLVLLCLASVGSAADRRSSPFPDEHWQGERTWRPERDRRWRALELPDRAIIDKPGKCLASAKSFVRGRVGNIDVKSSAVRGP